jgi:hypothetical protein
MSHAKRGDTTHNGVMPISMTQLILGTEGRINVAADAYMEMSHARDLGVTTCHLNWGDQKG